MKSKIKVLSILFLLILTFSGQFSCDPPDKKKPPCEDFICAGNQFCKAVNNKAVCLCPEGSELNSSYNECIQVKLCIDVDCGENAYCVDSDNGYTCKCDENYQKDSDDTCIFSCFEIEGARINDANDGCVCQNNNLYINKEENKCLLKEGCHLDEAICGENSQCKEYTNKDWYCECDEGYYLNNNTCVKNLCEDNQIECGETCCANTEICLSNKECTSLKNEICVNNEECLEGEICDTVAKKCIKKETEIACVFKEANQEEFFNSPNIVVDRIEIERIDCPELNFKIKIKVKNKGSLSVDTELPISIYQHLGTESSKALVATINTTEIILPGHSSNLVYNFIPETNDKSYNLIIIADQKENELGKINECNEADNSKTINFKGIKNLSCQTGIGECMRFSPYVCDENNELKCETIEVTPVDEICNDGLDNNCNGKVDEWCLCNDLTEQECYNLSSNLLVENARCKKGKTFCIGGENWGTCHDEILPIAEQCNGEDDDCDGEIDEDFPDLGKTCYSGIGNCRNQGVFVCSENGNMICDASVYDFEEEICGDNLDNNCNGITDESPCQSIE